MSYVVLRIITGRFAPDGHSFPQSLSKVVVLRNILLGRPYGQERRSRNSILSSVIHAPMAIYVAHGVVFIVAGVA